jgi:hypothetical protein
VPTRMAPFHGHDDALQEHIQLARRRELSREPFKFGLDRRRLRITQEGGKQRDRRAQPTQADPHLMHALGIAVDERRLVVDDVL